MGRGYRMGGGISIPKSKKILDNYTFAQNHSDTSSGGATFQDPNFVTFDATYYKTLTITQSYSHSQVNGWSGNGATIGVRVDSTQYPICSHSNSSEVRYHSGSGSTIIDISSLSGTHNLNVYYYSRGAAGGMSIVTTAILGR